MMKLESEEDRMLELDLRQDTGTYGWTDMKVEIFSYVHLLVAK